MRSELWRHHCDPNLLFNAEQQCLDHTFCFISFSGATEYAVVYFAIIKFYQCQLSFARCSCIHPSFNFRANKSRIMNPLQNNCQAFGLLHHTLLASSNYINPSISVTITLPIWFLALCEGGGEGVSYQMFVFYRIRFFLITFYFCQ